MEKYELVDKNGKGTGKILTDLEIDNKECIPAGYYVSIVGVLIINDNNEVLLEKRSKLKKINPGRWGICGGKVDLDETPLDAIIRETHEEIGIILKKDDLKFLCINKSEKAYFTIFYVRKNLDLDQCVLQKEEVDCVRYFNIEKLKELDSEGIESLN